jgi:prepilin-type N-terminal cleavage/methylation domain-containing protein
MPLDKFKAFTLVELLVVIAIIGLLSTIVLVATSGLREQAEIAKTLQWAKSIDSLLGADAVGIWNMDENPATQGTTIKDMSGWGNNGTLNTGETGVNKSVAGVMGQAISFDGVDDYINCGFGQSLKPNNKLSISVWVKMETPSTSRQPSILGNSYYTAGAVSGYRLMIVPNGTWNGASYWSGYWSDINSYYMGLCLYRGVAQGDVAWSGQVGYTVSASNMENKWNHIVAVFDRPVMKIYLNGREVGSGTYDYDIFYHQYSTYIGADSWNITSEEFSGLIDEVRIYNTALTASQIQSQYYVSLNGLLAKGLMNETEYNERLTIR